MAKKKTYDQNSISALKGADRVRLRPGVIFGSDDIHGCAHSIFEIISNSVDEAKEGYGDTINVIYYQDGTVSVEDFGRGIPLDWNEKEQRYNWELIFAELYAGAKYDTNGNYSTSLGLNGLGACATQYASEFMNVTVRRDNTLYEISFEKGSAITELKKTPIEDTATGSKIVFKPDIEVFEAIIVPHEILIDIMRRQAMLHKGVTFNLTFEGEEPLCFYYENGIVDYMASVTDEESRICDIVYKTQSMTGQDREDRPEYTVNMEMALTFTRKEPTIEFYHNSSDLSHGGVHDKALKKAIVKAFADAMKRTKEIKSSKITYKDIEDILTCTISTTCPGTLTSYENQTKKAINNSFIERALADFIEHFISEWTYTSPEQALKVMKEIEINKTTRESADEARNKVFKKLKGTSDNFNKPKKFVDCESKDVTKRELYIVEGDSALGACKLARNSEFQAIMPLRGKILNCLKAALVKISKSDVIMDLMRILGCGIATNDKALKDIAGYDLSKLKWDKIIICTDADIDGMQIRTLIITMLYILCPGVLEAGKVYIAETPLFEITHTNKKKEKTYFAYSDGERDQILSQLPEGKVTIQRSKGLGENTPEMMSMTTMNPDTRRLVQIKYTLDDELIAMFDALLGTNIEARRQLIEEYAAEYKLSTLVD